jgi:aminoglycoside phosphotransferase (APT) family kinase protein
MGRAVSKTSRVEPEQLEVYLRRAGYPDAHILELVPLGGDTTGGLKAYGYGRPLRVDFETRGERKRLTLRTMSPDPFSHDQRADRAYSMVLSYDTFNVIPKHIEAHDVGAFDEDGALVSIAAGEFFLVTDYVEGKLYAEDLTAVVGEAEPRELDLQRAAALGAYLGDLHRRPTDPQHYRRHIRDTVGTGEGIFGQSDSYPPDDAVAPPARLIAIEQKAIRWRFELRNYARRACITHGDFHPFNLLFRSGTDFSMLDASRGGAGESADDVTCMSINYLFFALNHHGRFTGPLRAMWDAFWNAYLDTSGDHEVFEMVPIYFTWRSLVLASPVWYPGREASVRDRLLTFAERLLDGEAFDPGDVDRLLE